jgi:perosamine synthetase
MSSSTHKKIVDFICQIFPGKTNIPLHEPLFVGKERQYVLDAIDSTFVSSVGKYVDKFEQMIRDYTGAKYAIATTNGTSALHMALVLAGVEQGDLVITQPFSFVATCNAICYIKADPYFIDIDSDTLGLSYQELKNFLSEQTFLSNQQCYHKETGKRISACLPMHTFGMPVEIDQIVDICEKYHIKVVEDSAESLGSLYKGQQTGTFGLLGTYSFNGNKTITCGGGGIIVTNNDELGRMAKHLTTQAKLQHKWAFKHDFVGYNYRLPNLNAALACAQMEQLESFIENKRETAKMYEEFFSSMSGVKFFKENSYSKSNYWLNAILFESQDEQQAFLEYSNSNGIMTRPGWDLLNTLPMYSNQSENSYVNARNIHLKLVNLPSGVRK